MKRFSSHLVGATLAGSSLALACLAAAPPAAAAPALPDSIAGSLQQFIGKDARQDMPTDWQQTLEYLYKRAAPFWSRSHGYRPDPGTRTDDGDPRPGGPTMGRGNFNGNGNIGNFNGNGNSGNNNGNNNRSNGNGNGFTTDGNGNGRN